jgi:uncharacterized protein
MSALNIWKSILATILYVVVLEVLGLIILVYLLIPDPDDLQTITLITNSLYSLGSLAMMVTVFFTLKKYIFSKDEDLTKLDLEQKIQYVFISICLGYIMIVIQPLIRMGFELLPGFQIPKIDSGELIQFEIWNIPLLLSSVMFIPISEELFFRGFLLKGLLKKNSLILSLLISSVLFGFLHFNWFTMDVLSLKRVFITFIGGLLAGGLYIKTKSITYPILFHLTWNLIANLDDFITIPFT